jgi:hypothetical protein
MVEHGFDGSGGRRGKFDPHAPEELGQRCGSISQPTTFRRVIAKNFGWTSFPST